MLEGFLLSILSLAAFVVFVAFACDFGAGLIMLIPAGLLALLFALIPVRGGDSYWDATSTKLGSEIIVQSPGVETTIVIDMKFIDKPLVFKKTILKNIYNCTPPIDYFIKQEVEIKQIAELNK